MDSRPECAGLRRIGIGVRGRVRGLLAVVAETRRRRLVAVTPLLVLLLRRGLAELRLESSKRRRERLRQTDQTVERLPHALSTRYHDSPLS
jgi:hypothetical protein